jgi:hypothetical protein
VKQYTLAIVLAAGLVPGEAERLQVVLRRLPERQARVDRMDGTVLHGAIPNVLPTYQKLRLQSIVMRRF